MIRILVVILLSITFVSCSKEKGCTDPNALNFNMSAEKDDGSCMYSAANDCWKQSSNEIIFTVLDGPKTELPSNVSILFKLDDNQGNSIPKLAESEFKFYEEGFNDECPTIVSMTEADRKLRNLRQVFRFSTILLLDLSGSVVENNLEELKLASKSFVESVIPPQELSGFDMSIWWFDGGNDINRIIDFTDNRQELLDAIDGITENLSSDQTTNLYGAVVQGVNQAEMIKTNLPHDLISSSAMVLFTDGRDRAQRETKANAYSAIDNASSSISFFAIGLGDEIRPEDLNKFGRDGLRLSENVDELLMSFDEVGELIIEEAGSYYNFEYCSPIRSGSAKLVIEVQHNNLKGFTEFTYSGEGFTSGCDL